MRHIIIFSAISAALSAYVFAASPAATQAWVRNYVSTNTTASASVTNAVGRAVIVSSDTFDSVMTILENDTSTNAVARARDAAISAVSPSVNSIMEGAVR